MSQYREFVERTRVPILANLTEFGKTPQFSVDQLRDAGVAMALYPLSAFRAMSRASEAVYAEIRQSGTQQSVVGIMQTRDELYETIGYHDYERKINELFTQRNRTD